MQITTCWIEIKSQIQNLQQFSNLFSSNRWTRKEPRSPRERIHHVHRSATTRIDFMDLSKGTDGTTARSFRRPPTTIGNGPQSGHLRQGTRWIADETKGEGWKERKNTKGKPERISSSSLLITKAICTEKPRLISVMENRSRAIIPYDCAWLLDSRYRMGIRSSSTVIL